MRTECKKIPGECEREARSLSPGGMQCGRGRRESAVVPIAGRMSNSGCRAAVVRTGRRGQQMPLASVGGGIQRAQSGAATWFSGHHGHVGGLLPELPGASFFADAS